MAYIGNFLTVFILSCSFFTHFPLSLSSGDDYPIELKNWVNVSEGWPLSEGESNSQFYYTKDKFEYLHWKIKPEFISNLVKASGETEQAFRISFKYWSHEWAGNLPPTTKVKVNTYSDVISTRYSAYQGYWMPSEYYVSYNDLVNFVIDVNTGDETNLVAIKDLKIEYGSKNTSLKNLFNLVLPSSSFEHQVIFDNNNNVTTNSSTATTNLSTKPSTQMPPTTQTSKPTLAPDYKNCEGVKCEIKDIDMNEDFCLQLEYPIQTETEIRMLFSASGDTIKEPILVVKPNVLNRENSSFCLSDILAFESGKAELRFESTPSVNLSITTEKRSKSKLAPKTFLHMMKVYADEETKNLINWQTEWKQISPSNPLFELKEDRVHFSASSISKTPASVHLMSQWIKYDPDLHKVDMKYSIQVNDQTLFDAFIIRPKVCDELSHCVDTYITNVQSDQSSTIRGNGHEKQTIDFNFPKMTAKYITLLFYVEYFQPQYSKDSLSSIEFDLRLLHFGDPCSNEKDTCLHGGVCYSDSEKGTPNKIICDCDSVWKGDRCQIADVCMTSDKKLGHSPGYHCQQNNTECQNWKDGFRCICKDDYTNWNGTNCVKPKDPTLDTWGKGSDGQYAPLKYPNKLTYEFVNINNEQDICLEIEYEAKKAVPLSVVYQVQGQTSFQFNYELPISSSRETICVKDFVYTPEESFTLSLSVMDRTVINTKAFNISLPVPKIQVVEKKPQQLIKFWDNIDTNYVQEQNWKSFPENYWQVGDREEKPVYKFSQDKLDGHEEIQTMLMSNWIEPHKETSSSNNQFAIRVPSNMVNYVSKLSTSLLYSADNKVKSKLDSYTLQTNDKPQVFRITIPDIIKSRFRLVIQITFTNKDSKPMDKDLELSIESVSVGDPCVDVKYCNKGKCNAIAPGVAQCDCQGSGAGDRCQFKDDKCSNQCHDYLAILGEKDKCVQFDETGIKCNCWDSYYKWNSNKCSRFFKYEEKQLQCEGVKCDFLDISINWANQNMPRLRKNDPNLPFYFTTKQADPMSILLNKVTKKTAKDVCFNLIYDVSNRSELWVTYNNNKPLFPLRKTVKEQWNNQKMCLSYLTKNIAPKDSKINIQANYLANPGDPVAVHFSKTDQEQNSLMPSIPFLIHWEDDNVTYTFENQWPIRVPEDAWVKTDQRIEFNGVNEGLRRSYIFSNWITQYVPDMSLRFKFSSTDYKNFVLSFALKDESNQDIEIPKAYLIGDSQLKSGAQRVTSTNSVVTIPIPEVKTSFRLAMIVDYNSTGSLFTIENIDLGDPCTGEDTQPLKCSEKGKCVRHSPVYGYECVCDVGNRGKTCGEKDWCGSPQDDLNGLSGDDYCGNNDYGTCQFGGIGGFYCTCTSNNNSFWDFHDKTCMDKPKCLSKSPLCDALSQDCKEPEKGDDHKDQAYCMCKEGFVNLGKSGSALQCEKYDPCNEKHRKIKLGDNHVKACGDSNAQCLNLSDLSGYKCACPLGFEQFGDQEDTQCQSRFCDNWLLNQCDQDKCDQDEKKNSYTCGCHDNYERKDGRCVLKSGKNCKCGTNAYCRDDDPNSCQCNDGYELIGNKCEPKKDYSVPDYVCPSGSANGTNQLECVCGQGFKLNSKTLLCDLEPICSKESRGRTNCSKKNALCVLDTANPGYFDCECPEGTDWYNGTQSQCVNYCDLPGRNDTCKNLNARCDPTVKVDEPDKYCKCGTGYVHKSGKICEVATRVVQFEMEIKNPFTEKIVSVKTVKNTENDLNKYKTVLKQFNDELTSTQNENERVNKIVLDYLKPFEQKNQILELIKSVLKFSVFKDSINSLAVIDCQLSGDPFLCKFAIDLKESLKKYSNWTEGLTDPHFCISYPGDSDHCFFPLDQSSLLLPNSFQSSGIPSLLIVNKKKLEQTKFDLRKACSYGDTICQGFTYCKDDSGDTTGYSCLCDANYFDKITLENKIGVTNNRCLPKDLCKDKCPKTEANGTCAQLEPKLNKENFYYVPVQCGCIDGQKLTNDSVKCVDACNGVECNNGKCMYSGQNGFTCLCNEGWNGVKCDSKYNDDKKWIITVTVLGVTLLLVIAIASFCLVKCRRDSEDVSFSSGGSLAEYNTTSFRVGQRPPILRISSTENGNGSARQENGKAD